VRRRLINSTLAVVLVVIAVFGIRQFYAQPLTGAPKAKASKKGKGKE